LGDLDIAVKKMPDNARAIFARGRCQLQLGQIAPAESDLRKAMALEPDNPEPINALAQLLWRSGRKEEAEPMFRQGREKAQAVRTVQPGEIRFEGSINAPSKPPARQQSKTPSTPSSK
jgi:Flp pilus assembly protein TadD